MSPHTDRGSRGLGPCLPPPTGAPGGWAGPPPQTGAPGDWGCISHPKWMVPNVGPTADAQIHELKNSRTHLWGCFILFPHSCWLHTHVGTHRLTGQSSPSTPGQAPAGGGGHTSASGGCVGRSRGHTAAGGSAGGSPSPDGPGRRGTHQSRSGCPCSCLQPGTTPRCSRAPSGPEEGQRVTHQTRHMAHSKGPCLHCLRGTMAWPSHKRLATNSPSLRQRPGHPMLWNQAKRRRHGGHLS